MAPEIIDSNVYNVKTDMYAFGMCLLEILTKKTPYSECSSTSELIAKILSVPVPSAGHFQGEPPAALAEITDPDFKQLITQLLGPPETRPTAADLLMDSFLLQDGDEVAVSQRESAVEFRPVENWIPVQFPRVFVEESFVCSCACL